MRTENTPLPSRRAFAGLLTAGAGLAALTACTPQNGTPSPAGATVPVQADATPSAAASSTAAAPTTEPTATAEPTVATPSPAPSSTLKTQYSLTDPTSPWVVVNKHRPLNPQNFVPADLVQPAIRLAVSGEAALLNSTTAAAAEKMFGAAASEGVIMTLASGYRSYTTQVSTYNGYVASSGQAGADHASARPGHSEHQTGWAFDIGDGGGACSFQPCFAEQPAAVWAKANAHKYGFVVRYPWMFHETTGYFYESWHLRYIGVDAAVDMATRGIATLEEYFGLEAAPDYL
ncbi:D-alanyl-D-alanine carboxypeptidase family protein [Paenarthrobacter sp. JL.01a]|uniref:M15 family metallopeptidase n=1 Tax=Paenarthrobacter sp. JL.01a TaxID=2979324 RepID=UPI0021C58DEE|nr:M15 family metallopeptidase [Paenarthrobacter sp. JL.01a]UXM90529.1 M15 family metallopeptidase [Paenarthrobacter sp. JL.01a]